MPVITVKVKDKIGVGGALGVISSPGRVVDVTIRELEALRTSLTHLQNKGLLTWSVADSSDPNDDAAESVAYSQLTKVVAELRAEIRATEHVESWPFQTNSTTQYAGGYYDFFVGDNDFSPSVSFGSANASKAAHILVVTGAPTADQVTIRVSGTSIDDAGTEIASDTDDIVIPSGTPADSYFESKKFNGQVTIETVAGTPVTCNYGWSKYYDENNQDFFLVGLECLWESDSSDSGSDILLIHHKSTGWSFNSGSIPSIPTPLAQRSVDHSGNNSQEVGPGAWKRSNLNLIVNGSDSEGILFCVTSGNTGIGSLSFRIMSLQVMMTQVP